MELKSIKQQGHTGFLCHVSGRQVLGVGPDPEGDRRSDDAAEEKNTKVDPHVSFTQRENLLSVNLNSRI